MAGVKKKKIKTKSGGRMDVTFLAFVLILLTVGLVMLFSASYAYSLEYYGNSYKFITQQALVAVVGIFFMLFVSRINYHIIRRLSWVVFFITIAMLVFLLIAPPMVKGMDVKRW